MTELLTRGPSSGPPQSIGLPRMAKEASEKRVFLPKFVQRLANQGLDVYLEQGYGSLAGYSFEHFRMSSRHVHQCARREAYQKDAVLVLRSPERYELDCIPPGTCLISMLHYHTRPGRVDRLAQRGIKSISLDSIVNDEGIRLVENMKAVAWNGLEAAFDVLEEQLPGLQRPDGGPLQVLILGTGLVGKLAVEAATKLGNLERFNAYLERGGGCVVAQSVGRGITTQPDRMERLFRQADILVDATARHDPSKPVVPNSWIARLPAHSVIADLAVDPYLPHDNPPVVRGVEGIPKGSLDQYCFTPEDPNWCATIPPGVPTAHRRTVVSCYSWPGIYPDPCMGHYGRQLRPLLKVLVRKGYDSLSLEGDYFERALTRGTIKHWLS